MTTKQTQKTILLTGGRAPVTLEVSRMFHRAGHRVLMAESIPFSLCQTSRSVTKFFRVPAPRWQPEAYICSLEAIIQNEQVDLLLPTCEEVFTISRYHSRLSSLCRVWTEPIERLAPLHHKWAFVQQAQGLGTRTPETFFISDQLQLKKVIDQWHWNSQLILKPVYSRFSAHTHVLTGPQDKMPRLPISTNQPWVAQELIVGKQICSYSIANAGRLVAHVAYPSQFTAGKGATIHFRPLQHPLLQQYIASWLARTHRSGQFAFDWLETAQGELIPIECNPRMTSGVHLFTNLTLAQAFLIPEKITNPIVPPSSQSSMLTLAMLTYGFQSSLSANRLREWLKTMMTTPDIIFRWRDPLPFFQQLWMLIYLYTTSKRKRISMLEASTWDIEWNGEKT
ncbi:carbamoylphosphate synthase large subunit [Hazenella sp. IB182357]|uniref:Carbamoylphosphate synthase large subunit n=1 Tax=Polycladospora coralii TaxID=2771432 RepID=A0A926NDH3_9BACL|nr:carbamoylphosphate synthase large subunit [Polycladospora coralii]MBD1371448.1 carbamoylphosphate synthase large subunit [Polycladospora coralii]MBS7530416.1 carbamoylphosphate synthase large subunit [Polycladospora coralii]